jgi:hypothetical protein
MEHLVQSCNWTIIWLIVLGSSCPNLGDNDAAGDIEQGIRIRVRDKRDGEAERLENCPLPDYSLIKTRDLKTLHHPPFVFVVD